MPAKSACTEWSMLTKTSWYSSWLAAASAAAVSLYQGRGTVHLIKVLDFLGNRAVFADMCAPYLGLFLDKEDFSFTDQELEGMSTFCRLRCHCRSTRSE